MKNCAIGFLAAMALGIGLTFGLGMACVDPDDDGGGGSTSGTALYVFDASAGATNRVLVYTDVAALFEAGTGEDSPQTVQPTRQMRDSRFDNNVRNLAWGGMCFDPNGNRLILVSKTGEVVRVERARSQNGTIPSQEIASFSLGASDSERLSSSEFGQASIDARDGTLYVTEFNSSDTRVWVVRNPSSYIDGSSVSSGDLLFVSGDKNGTGVAARNGDVYAYFDSGGVITPPLLGTSYTGPRLRRGTASGFPNDILNPTSLIIGTTDNNITRLAKYGTLALDNSDNVYMARHLTDAAVSGDAILVFRAGDFYPGLNQAPGRVFGAGTSNLRVITHAVTKDWLAGALSNGDNGTDAIVLWRAPSAASPQKGEYRIGSGASIRGLALDGSN